MGIPCCKEPAVLFLPQRVSLLAFFVGIGNNAGSSGSILRRNSYPFDGASPLPQG